MNKTPTHLLLALALTLLAACSADSSSSSPTGADPRALQRLEESTAACWGPTGSTSTPRTEHTATVLPNGKVLVVGGGWTHPSPNGGWLEAVFHASAEVYDPTSGTWSATGSMSVARRSHTATLLPNGKVLVAGGINDLDAPYASAELYDPATGTWSATGSMSAIRFLHTATLLPDGKVLVAGGVTQGLNGARGTVGSAEVYDPATGTWSATGSLVVARRSHAATLLPNGKALIVGGSTDGGTTFASAEVYDPATGTWSATGSMSVTRRAHTQTLLPNGKVLVAGGSSLGAAVNGPFASAEVYDPATGTWSATGSMSVTRVNHAAALLANGKVLVTGSGGSPQVSAEVYDPATGTWSATGSMATPRTYHSALALANGKVLVVAGTYGYFNHPLEAELYSCGVEDVATCPDGSPWSEVGFSSGTLSLSLHCPQQMTLECGASTWADPGASAADDVGPVGVHKYNTGDDDGDGVPGAQDPDDFGPGPNMSVAGSYSMEYIAWNTAATVSAVRTVLVQDSTPPVLKLKGPAQTAHVCGSEWVDPGVEASDRCDGDLTHTVEKTGSVNGWSEGTYTLTYSLTDNAQNSAPALTRTVEVVDCPW